MISNNKITIIAEIGNTHEGSIFLAKKFIDAAIETGVDAVKFQTHIAEAETLINAPMPPYFKGEPRFEYFKRTSFNKDEWKDLKKYTENKGAEFISSPFSNEAVDLLNEIGVKTFKIASGEVSNIPLLEKIAKTKKHTLLSSGMSSWKEIDEAVKIFKTHDCPITILQCTSKYPANAEDVGLNIINEMKQRYNKPVGFSDHSLTNYSAFASVMLGVSVIEKHFTLSKLMYGSDAKHSLEPTEFKELVEGVRFLEKAMQNPIDKNNNKEFGKMKNIFEKSIVANIDLKEGEIINEKSLAYKKPGDGIPAREYKNIIGKKLKIAVNKDYKFKREDFN